MKSCKCCRRPATTLNSYALCPGCDVCLHCEAEASINGLGLCEICTSHPRIRRLYLRGKGWTPEWEQHLRTLTAIHQEEMRLKGINPKKEKHREECRAITA